MERFFTRRVLLEVTLLVSLVFVGYSNIRVLLKNIALNKQIQTLETDLSLAKQRNERLALLNTYYQTPSFQEVEARKRFSMKKPDEQVASLKNVSGKEVIDLSSWQNTPLPTSITPSTLKSNPRLWWEYFFGNS